jgi:hypothetical protein
MRIASRGAAGGPGLQYHVGEVGCLEDNRFELAELEDGDRPGVWRTKSVAVRRALRGNLFQ